MHITLAKLIKKKRQCNCNVKLSKLSNATNKVV